MDRFPDEIELIICRYVHELRYCDVMVQMSEQCYDDMIKMFKYFRKSVFYPYTLIKRIGQNLNHSIYWRRRLDKYLHYKLLSRCFKDIIKPDHTIFIDDD